MLPLPFTITITTGIATTIITEALTLNPKPLTPKP